MSDCPYPKTIIDETSGIEVSNPEYVAYQRGRVEVVEWVKTKAWQGHATFGFAPLRGYLIREEDWQAFVKTMLPEEVKDE